MRAWLLLALLLGGISLAQSALELEVLRRTNQVRTEHGLRPLRWDSLAYKAALGHAKVSGLKSQVSGLRSKVCDGLAYWPSTFTFDLLVGWDNWH